MLVNHFSPQLDGIQLSFVQFFVVSVLSTIFAFVFEAPSPDQFRAAAVSIAYCGIMSSGVAYTLQILGQQDLNPAIASLIMCLESVFSALGGWLLLSQSLSAREAYGCALIFAAEVLAQLHKVPGCESLPWNDVQIASTIFAVKPGDGSAREQAASCQKVLGGWANIANEYATKRYRSNLINWGMLPSITEEEHTKLSFRNGDYLFEPDIRKAVEDKASTIKAYVVGDDLKEIDLKLGDLTDAEREIILKGCLINYYKG